MKTIGKTLTKGTIGAAAVGAMAFASATPAAADSGISVGEVIAGAVILGGIAAVAGSIGNNNDRYDRTYGGPYYGNNDYRYDRNYGYNNYGNPRQAVEQCVNAAERDARRYGYRNADVTQIRDVDRKGNGYRVRGNLVVNGGYGYNDRYNDRSGNYRYDSRYNNQRNYDDGSFTCEVRNGRVNKLDYSGIRGLR